MNLKFNFGNLVDSQIRMYPYLDFAQEVLQKHSDWEYKDPTQKWRLGELTLGICAKMLDDLIPSDVRNNEKKIY